MSSPTYGRLPVPMAQELYSIAYIETVASAAGCVTSRDSRDIGIDLQIRQEPSDQQWSEAAISVQAKSTIEDTWQADDLVYDLDVRTYDYLRDEDVYVPRMLVVMTVPRIREHWLQERDGFSELRKHAFWLSLLGAPQTSNASKIRVKLPRAQRFTVEALCGALSRVGRRERI